MLVLIVTPFMIPHLCLINIIITYKNHLIVAYILVSLYRECVPSRVSCDGESIASFEGYDMFNNLLWCGDTLFDNKNLFLEDGSMFTGRVVFK